MITTARLPRRSFLWSTFALGCSACAGAALGPAGARPHTESSQSRGDPAAAAELARTSNRFAADLWSRFSSTPGNLALSPASISLAFGMAYGGARGTTADEMARVLRFDGMNGSVHDGFGALLARWNDPERTAYDLRIANRLFGEATSRFDDAFVALTREAYDAELERLDFRGAPDESRERINRWIEERTNDRIRDLLPRGSIGPLVRLVLTNAIYFKGRWLHQFDTRMTRPADFYPGPNIRLTVPTMHASREVPFARLDGYSALELPYVGDDLSMLLLLPEDGFALPALEARLDASLIESTVARLAPAEVDVALPRFKIDPPAPIQLGETLRAMGMRLAFSEDADLTGMSPQRPLYLAEAFHKAFVEVNEEGTEAAAATAIVAVTTSARINPTFVADHPFLFVIRDRSNGAILFMGRVADPR
jgi:serpin B